MADELQDGLSLEDQEKDVLKHADALTKAIDLDDPNIDPASAVTGMLEDDSPYPEVRCSVANTDDPTILVSTVRVWVIGLSMTILFAGLNQFFYFRYPTVNISSYVVLLVSLPLGRLWAAVVPNRRVFGVSLNPGPFNIKEHVLLAIMAAVASGPAYATDVVAVQRVFYDQIYSFGYQWMLVMSTQLLGFSIGGILQRLLVQPPSMIWPSNLVLCTLFNTLHASSYTGMGSQGGITRGRFFLYAWVVGMVWYIFPGYLFQALSYFSWVCWIAPDNVVVNQVFGYVHGLGMSVITFDWAQIAFNGSPLVTPWWVEANVAVGFFFFIWFVTPVLYFTNTWYSEYMPISSRVSYDNTGNPYNVSQIINPDASFNLTAYEEYSPIFLPTTFALAYGLSFASITATVMHAFLYFRKLIWRQGKHSVQEKPDIHARLMSKYKQVPDWWYGVILVSMVVFGIVSIEVWHTEFPVWAFLLSLAISFLLVIPIGMILAITNQEVGLNVIAELMVGYMLPGRPIAMMMFKTWGTITVTQALSFSGDFKLGHYMKIPPRSMFWCQVVATVIAGTVQLGVQAWMFSNIPDICQPTQKNGFICPVTEVFETASIVWGVIGPMRVFSSGQLYNGLMYFFLLGALCPVVAYLIHLKWPRSFVRYIHFPVLFSSAVGVSSASAVNYIPWIIVGFVFNYYIKRRHSSWWAKYNYVLSAAMDSGVAFMLIIIFFALQYPQNGTIGANTVQTWWGNMVFLNTADGKGLPYRTVPNGATFGPTTW